ncbi:MAG: endospore germination permease [Bacillota bacterium]|nr:endospore germination permease [Bacillota bacterium]MDW7685351.1 endospore germination permease [Bacillota bacterium]
MMNSSQSKSKDTMDPKVLAVVLAMAIFEFEIFTHARGLVDIAKQDTLLVILLGGSLLLLLTSLLVKLARRFPKENLFQYSKKVWGRPVGLLITLAYLFYFYSFMVLLFQNFTNANRVLFLPRTPVLVPMLLMAVGAVWLASYGFAAIVRFFQLIFPIFALLMLTILFLGIREVSFENYLPLLSNGFLPVLHGAVVYVGIIQGIEIILFLTPFLNDTNKILKPAAWGVIPVIFFMFFASVNAIGILGVANIPEFVYPGIALLSVIELPGFAVERFELLLTLPWLIAIFTTMSVYIYLLAFGIIELFGLSHRKVSIGIVAAAIIGATYLIPDMAWTIVLRQHFNYFTLLFTAVIPALTLLMAAIRHKEGTDNA